MRPRVRAVAAALVAVATLGVGPSAAAAPPDAVDLAADCNADGRLDIDGTARYVGGVGVLTTDCVVTMTAGSRLILRGIDLSSAAEFFVIGNAANDTTVRVVGSTIDLGGFLQLAPGCCSGDPAFPEQDATIVVRDSFLRGTSVEVSASTASTGGRVRVRRSTLDATATSTVVRASESSDVVVTDSNLAATTDLVIESTIGGRTRVARSSLAGASITISAGPGGTCTSTGNTPPVPCT